MATHNSTLLCFEPCLISAIVLWNGSDSAKARSPERTSCNSGFAKAKRLRKAADVRRHSKMYTITTCQMKKLGRNDKCSCEGGKKYKHCCLKANESTMTNYIEPSKVCIIKL